MEIGRLSPEQIITIQTKERNSGRALMPYEIDALYGFPPLKEHYGIPPDDLTAQAGHNQRLRGDFRRANIYPEHDLPQKNVEKVHSFDQEVVLALEQNRINLHFMGGSPRRKRMADQIEA